MEDDLILFQMEDYLNFFLQMEDKLIFFNKKTFFLNWRWPQYSCKWRKTLKNNAAESKNCGLGANNWQTDWKNITLYMKMFIFRLLWYFLFSLSDLWNSQWSGEEWHAVLPAGLLHALHPHPAPQAGGQGEVQHRGGNHGRCGDLCVLHPLCDMPDFSGGQGKGRQFLERKRREQNYET